MGENQFRLASLSLPFWHYKAITTVISSGAQMRDSDCLWLQGSVVVLTTDSEEKHQEEPGAKAEDDEESESEDSEGDEGGGDE